MPIMMFAAMWGAIFGMFSQTTERNAEDARTPAIGGRPYERGSNQHEHPLDPPG
jgi:hypothetical protein